MMDLKPETHWKALKIYGWLWLYCLAGVLALLGALGGIVLFAILHMATPVWSHWAALVVSIIAGVYWVCWTAARDAELDAERWAKLRAEQKEPAL